MVDLGQEVLAALEQAKAKRSADIVIDGRRASIAKPFPSPADWRDQPIYFLMVDRFNNPDAAPRRPFDQPFVGFQGGTFEGIRRQLGYLKDLGVGAIWLTPVLQNPQWLDGTYHGYGIQHFLRVDPRFASDPSDPEGELRRLIDEAHARDIYVIFDIVLNHAGDVFAYALGDGRTESEAPWRDRPYPIRWRDETGTPRPEWSEAPADGAPGLTEAGALWPSALRRNAFLRRQGLGGEAGGDFASLKEFVTREQEVRHLLILIHQWVIAAFDVDGFRIDTLKYVEPDFARIFGNAMREFAQQIGKLNFFTFGEVYDNEEKIAHFIGRHALEEGEMTGVDAALDFPLFYVLPGMAKGFVSPAAVAGVFAHRKEVQRGIISSHGEASRFFVTFLDNHDQRSRIRHSDPNDPNRYDDQVTLSLACIYALQGIPCLYYGTEQGLSGSGDSDAAVREALWGRPGGFDGANPFYEAVAAIARLRRQRPALRYGRQYVRPVSGDRFHFAVSGFAPGVLAFSRILNDEEVVVVANAHPDREASLSVLVDANLNAPGSQLNVLYSNKPQPAAPEPVERIETVHVEEPEGGTGRGPVHAVRVTLGGCEVQILGR